VFNTLGSTVNWWVGKVIADGGIARLPPTAPAGPSHAGKGERLFGAMAGWRC
jgi:hypothetical protein